MEHKWVVVCFGDIRGFGAWTYRASNPPEVRRPFVQTFYDVLQRYIREKRFSGFTYLGDGIMVVKEFPVSAQRVEGVTNFVLDVFWLTRFILRAIRGHESPPDGWRIRFMSGYVDKLMVLDPYDPLHLRAIPAYVGYPPNSAARLLEVHPETVCLAHFDVVKFFGPRTAEFQIQKVDPPRRQPTGVNPEDLRLLYEVGIVLRHPPLPRGAGPETI